MREKSLPPGLDPGVREARMSAGLLPNRAPAAPRLSAWTGVCPGNRESAGKAQPAAARKGKVHLKTALCNAAIGASKKNNSYFKAKYHKLKARRGGGRAALAIAHKLLIAVYHVLKGDEFRDLGEAYLDQRNIKRAAARHVKHLETLGFNVKIEPKPKTSTP